MVVVLFVTVAVLLQMPGMMSPGSVNAQVNYGQGIVIQLNWEPLGTDADLHVFHSDGGHAYYGDPYGISGGFINQDDTTQSQGGEFFIMQNPRSGRYQARVNYYSGTSPITATLRVFIDGQVKFAQSHLLTQSDGNATNGIPMNNPESLWDAYEFSIASDNNPKPFISVTQMTTPNSMVKPGNVVEYTVFVRNHGKGSAKNVEVTMPLDPSVVVPLDATFSSEEAWVSELTDNRIVFQSGKIERENGMVSATIRLFVREHVAPGTSLDTRLLVDGRGVAESLTRSNALPLVVGDENIQQPFLPLVADIPAAPENQVYNVTGNVFLPDERVSFWYHTPQGEDIPIGTVSADTAGIASLSVVPFGLPAGHYSIVAEGDWSRVVALYAFQIAGSAADAQVTTP
jgi:uncharacterized repeat protein (TIGR01451 family)